MAFSFASAPPHVYARSQGTFHLLGLMQVSGLALSACLVITQAKTHSPGSHALAI